MQFKVGDRVKAIRGYFIGEEGVILIAESPCSDGASYEVRFDSGRVHRKVESNLELVRGAEPKVDPIRTFDTGATRDTTQGKLDYVRALSPIVLRRYVRYLDKHRLQPDGSYREFDNWKQGIPQDVYQSSKMRHAVDEWLLTEGYAAEDNHGPVEIEDALCAQLFNVMGRLHEILKNKVKHNA